MSLRKPANSRQQSAAKVEVLQGDRRRSPRHQLEAPRTTVSRRYRRFKLPRASAAALDSDQFGGSLSLRPSLSATHVLYQEMEAMSPQLKAAAGRDQLLGTASHPDFARSSTSLASARHTPAHSGCGPVMAWPHAPRRKAAGTCPMWPPRLRARLCAIIAPCTSCENREHIAATSTYPRGQLEVIMMHVLDRRGRDMPGDFRSLQHAVFDPVVRSAPRGACMRKGPPVEVVTVQVKLDALAFEWPEYVNRKFIMIPGRNMSTALLL